MDTEAAYDRELAVSAVFSPFMLRVTGAVFFLGDLVWVAGADGCLYSYIAVCVFSVQGNDTF